MDNIIPLRPNAAPVTTSEDAELVTPMLTTEFSAALRLMVFDKIAMRRKAWDPKIQFVFFQPRHEVRLGDIIDTGVLPQHLPSSDIGIVYQAEFYALELFRHVYPYTFTTKDLLAEDWEMILPQPELGT